MSDFRHIFTHASMVALAAMGFSASIAHAQDSSGAAAAPADNGEIIVTAQRRSEKLQDVPIAITVVSGDALEQSQFKRLQDLQYLAPSLKFQPLGSNGNPSFAIRGVGTNTFDDSVEQAVGVVLDDVVQLLPRNNFLNTLVDVDHIEVLRGPQGTLFGKNADAGLISISTRRPQIGVLSNDAHLQYGSFDAVQLYDIANIPVSDTVALRLRAAYQRRDGVLYNRAFDRHDRESTDWSANGKLLWEPSDGLSVLLAGDIQNSSSTLTTTTLRSFSDPTNPANFVSAIQSSLGIVAGPDNFEIASGGLGYKRTRVYGGQAAIQYDLGDHMLTSVTAYRKVRNRENGDSDLTPLRIFDFNQAGTDARQVTQEIRLASPTGNVVSYIVGLYYSDLKSTLRQVQGGTLGLLPEDSPFLLAINGNGMQVRETHNRSAALFGEVTVNPVEAMRVFVGGRYTWDKTVSSLSYAPAEGFCLAPAAFGAPCYPTPFPTDFVSGRRSHGDWSGRAGVQYNFNPDFMGYATISRGYKGAAVTTVSSFVNQVEPETVWTYEGGVKTTLLDHALTANLAVYYSKFKDFQAQAYDATIPPAGAFTYTNAGSLTTKGFEVELSSRPARGLNLSWSLAYADATYGAYFAPCYPAIAGTPNCLPNGSFDASGLGLPNSPKWTFNASASYDGNLDGDYGWHAGVNFSQRSSVLFQVGDVGTKQQGYGILNANLGFGPANDRWRVTVFARNLFDQLFAANIFAYPLEQGIYAQAQAEDSRRTVGVSLDVKLGG